MLRSRTSNRRLRKRRASVDPGILKPEPGHAPAMLSRAWWQDAVNRLWDSISPPTPVYAHCDIPCGIYDPHEPQAGLIVLGDNETHSRDSRQFGMVPLHLVVGKVRLRATA